MPNITIPKLDHFSGSWVVTRKADGSVIGEFYNSDNVRLFNLNTCRIETTLQYLNRINRETRLTLER